MRTTTAIKNTIAVVIFLGASALAVQAQKTATTTFKARAQVPQKSGKFQPSGSGGGSVFKLGTGAAPLRLSAQGGTINSWNWGGDYAVTGTGLVFVTLEY